MPSRHDNSIYKVTYIVKVYKDTPRGSLDIIWDSLGMATCSKNLQYALHAYKYAPKTVLLLPGHGNCLQEPAKSLHGHSKWLTVRHYHALSIYYHILIVYYHVYWVYEYVHIYNVLCPDKILYLYGAVTVPCAHVVTTWEPVNMSWVPVTISWMLYTMSIEPLCM
jgi:hypothetical protein